MIVPRLAQKNKAFFYPINTALCYNPIMNKKFWILNILNFALFCGFLLGTLTILVYFVPQVEEVLKEFDAELPVATTFFISLSNLVTAYWFILIPVYLIISAGISLLITQLLIKLRDLYLMVIYFFAITLSAGAFVIFAAISIYMPLQQITL